MCSGGPVPYPRTSSLCSTASGRDPAGRRWRWVIPVLAVAAIIWGALMALVQSDMKLLVSYSSISHMGFIVLGIFALNVQGQQGAVLQMVNHGIIIAALFLIVGWIADTTGVRDRSALAGLALRMPVMAGGVSGGAFPA